MFSKTPAEQKLEDLTGGKRTNIIELSYEAIEKHFELLGATIVEDKLQEAVPQTIQQLKIANIKFWVLTGDRMNTAVNIGYSCNLISNEQQIFSLKLEKDKNINITDKDSAGTFTISDLRIKKGVFPISYYEELRVVEMVKV